jgi:hypothetical protein
LCAPFLAVDSRAAFSVFSTHVTHVRASADPQESRVDSTNPLAERGILQHVLGYVGPGHWLFEALLSRGWHQAYVQVPECHLIGFSLVSPRIPVVCVPQMTLYSAALASAARLALAQKAGLDLSSRALQLAAGKWGSKAIISSLVQPGMSWYGMLIGALQSRSLDILQWLVEELRCSLPGKALEVAALGGCTDVLVWLKQRGEAMTAELLQYAAANGHWNAVQYLRNEGLEWSSEVCGTAASFGQLTLLQQLRENGCPWDAESISIDAACSGSVPLLQWLKGQGIAFTERTVAGAVTSGRIAACEYLRFTEHCPWSLWTSQCMLAAKYNQLDVLKWLREHGCPCDDQCVCVAAARGGSIDVMAYMLEQLQQLGADVRTELLREMLAAAGAKERLVPAQWLRAQGAEWPVILQYAFGDEPGQWSGAVLEWARSEGCTSPVE